MNGVIGQSEAFTTVGLIIPSTYTFPFTRAILKMVEDGIRSADAWTLTVVAIGFGGENGRQSF